MCRYKRKRTRPSVLYLALGALEMEKVPACQLNAGRSAELLHVADQAQVGPGGHPCKDENGSVGSHFWPLLRSSEVPSLVQSKWRQGGHTGSSPMPAQGWPQSGSLFVHAARAFVIHSRAVQQSIESMLAAPTWAMVGASTASRACCARSSSSWSSSRSLRSLPLMLRRLGRVAA